MEKPQLRAVGKPRNLYNSRSISLDCTSCDATANSTAISQQERYFTPARLPIGVSSIQSHPYGLVLQAFPSKVRPSCEIPLPILTSTPIASKAASNSSKTVLIVFLPQQNYEQEPPWKLSDHQEGVSTWCAFTDRKCGNEKSNAQKSRHRKCTPIRIVHFLRKTGKEDLANFDLLLLCNEWKERAPLFYVFLMTSAVNKKT